MMRRFTNLWTYLPFIVFSVFMGIYFTPLASAQTLENVGGVWLTEAKNGHVEIADCGDGTPCGHLIWVELNPDGSVPNDANNPDDDLSSQSLIGVKMLHSFKLKGERWRRGKIYNPSDGKTYGSSLKRLDADRLQVKGCVGPICKKQVWTRVEQAGKS